MVMMIEKKKKILSKCRSIVPFMVMYQDLVVNIYSPRSH